MKLFSLLLLTLSIGTYSAQLPPSEVNLDKFIEETQIESGGDDDIHLVWWLPAEFWEVSFAQDESMTQDQVDEMMVVLKPYTIFAVIDGAMGVFGGITYQSKEKTKEYIHVQTDKGMHLRPIEEEEYSEDLRNLLNAFTPIMSNMIGPMGENMHFYVFSDNDRLNNRAIDPTDSKHSFEVIAATDFKVRFELPLSTLLEPKICPVDKAVLNGKWNYCPMHGKELKKRN